ncbi:hypothetical protein [Roseateles sp.]|uniref:hypothetical protein n=1 Tax=Roseateles sp. TaxID=1971397 RepID=UPI0032648A1A
MGRAHDLGSLEVGKLADVAGREQVSNVWVGGRQVLRERQSTTVGVPALLAEVREVVGRMQAG